MKKSILMVFALTALVLTSCKKEASATEDTVDSTAVSNSDAPAVEGAEAFAVQPADSKLDWEGGKISGDKHSGFINFKEGEVLVKDGKVVGGKFVLDMNTIESTDIKDDPEMKIMLDGHLKGTAEDKEKADHFFNVTQYPTATFEITSVAEENGKQVVEGNLTIKDKTNPIKFTAQVKVDGDNASLVSDEIIIDRTKWNVNYNSGSVIKDLAADKVIKDEIKVLVSVLAKK